jgi:hypothetical protein
MATCWPSSASSIAAPGVAVDCAPHTRLPQPFGGHRRWFHLPTDGQTGGESLPAQRRLHLCVASGLPAGLSLTARNPSRPSLAPRLQVAREAWRVRRNRRLPTGMDSRPGRKGCATTSSATYPAITRFSRVSTLAIRPLRPLRHSSALRRSPSWNSLMRPALTRLASWPTADGRFKLLLPFFCRHARPGRLRLEGQPVWCERARWPSAAAQHFRVSEGGRGNNQKYDGE